MKLYEATIKVGSVYTMMYIVASNFNRALTAGVILAGKNELEGVVLLDDNLYIDTSALIEDINEEFSTKG